MVDGNKKICNYGHSVGVKVVESIISEAISNKIKYLTLYTFR